MIRHGLALSAALTLGAIAAHAENTISPEGLSASTNTVSIGTVTAEKDGYVVVHRTDFTGTLPGSVIGHAPVKAGQNAEVRVTLDKQAKEWAAEKGYDPVYGARPLKRFLQRQIETKLARALIGGEVGEGAAVAFKVKGDELVIA